jgi:methylphosphotriester-DNA--protein-cysteine methyltransferase
VSAVVYTEALPAASLAGVVRCYWSIEGVLPPGVTVGNRVLPDGCTDVIFNLADAPSGGIGTLPEPGYVVGAMLEAFVVGLRGRVDVIGVRFQPGAAGVYLGVPATELTARSVGLSEVRREGRTLAERMYEAGQTVSERVHEASDTLSEPMHEAGDTVAGPDPSGGWPAAAATIARQRLRNRAMLLDQMLAAGHCGDPDPLVAEAVRRIESSHGTVAVADLERALSVSARTLTRRFAAAVGITPKTACRVARLQAAASEIRRDSSASLARIAVRTGFHDQSHLNRDFMDLARVTPAGYAREARDGFIQDETVSDV